MSQWTRDRVRELFQLANDARALELADRFETNRAFHGQRDPRRALQHALSRRGDGARSSAAPAVRVGDVAGPEVG